MSLGNVPSETDSEVAFVRTLANVIKYSSKKMIKNLSPFFSSHLAQSCPAFGLHFDIIPV
jgi:hypothetical protein